MKKHLAIFLAFLMAFSAITAISPVSAANEAEAGSTPDDAFDGNYTEFTGSDGSVTRVFDNGSVSTKNTDGSVTAVDYKGNQYSEDKDGNATVRTTDGYVATEYADGRQSLTEPSGKTTTINTDGSFSESFGVGLTLDYNADGGLTGIGITGGDQRIETDENGCYSNGEITGPNGTKLTITDDGMKFVNAEGTVYDHTDLGNKQTTTIDRKDGSHAEAETSVTWNGDEKTENTDYTITDSDGNRWDSNTNITYDSDGNPKTSNNNVVQWTGADGSTLWMDNNSKAVQYSDKNGNKLITDPNGNVTEYKDGKNSLNVTYDGNGNVTSADVTYSDGAKMVQNPDGTATFTLPDGTEYKSDGNGNVFRDGEPIKVNGEWVESSESDQTEPDQTEPGVIEPEDPPESAFSIHRVAGTYHISGYDAWDDFEDDEYDGRENDSYDLTFTVEGENSLVVSAGGSSQSVKNYDPTTGSCGYTDEDGVNVYIQFSESGGVYSVSITYDKTFEGGRSYGSYSGTKK